MSSIRDVARLAGVSIATVSRVINGAKTVAPDLRKRVVDAVEQCEYTPSVRRQSLDSIALVYTGPFTIGGPYDSACIEGMVEALCDTTYDLSILHLNRDKAHDETLRQFFIRKGVRAAILRCTTEQREQVAQFARERLPLVVLGDHFDCTHPLSFVYGESAAASQLAMEHLITLGHKRIAFAGCDRDDGDHLDRLQAYQSVLQAVDLYDEQLVCRIPAQRMDGAQLLRNLLGMPNRPTALFVADPLVAVGVVNESQSIKAHLPDDLSVIGFDDGDLRNAVYPRMSAVCQDARLLGRNALELAIELAEEGINAEPRKATHAAWLDLGNTTGPPPRQVDRIMSNGMRMSAAAEGVADQSE